MGNYILCRQQKASVPYFIENISTNVFSAEELCFYLSHNIYLLDHTIIEENLCRWLGNELGMRHLAARLSAILKTAPEPGAFILPIFREVHYLSQSETKELQSKLQQLAELPPMAREKLKGDYLVRYGKYGNGIKVYETILETTANTTMGSQFEGGVYHNMGCAYAKLFQTDEALQCLQKAYEMLHSKAALKSYLFAIYIARSQADYEAAAKELGVDDQTRAEIDRELEASHNQAEATDSAQAFGQARREKAQGNLNAYYNTVDELLEQMTEDYHKNTGY